MVRGINCVRAAVARGVVIARKYQFRRGRPQRSALIRVADSRDLRGNAKRGRPRERERERRGSKHLSRISRRRRAFRNVVLETTRPPPGTDLSRPPRARARFSRGSHGFRPVRGSRSFVTSSIFSTFYSTRGPPSVGSRPSDRREGRRLGGGRAGARGEDGTGTSRCALSPTGERGCSFIREGGKRGAGEDGGSSRARMFAMPRETRASRLRRRSLSSTDTLPESLRIRSSGFERERGGKGREGEGGRRRVELGRRVLRRGKAPSLSFLPSPPLPCRPSSIEHPPFGHAAHLPLSLIFQTYVRDARTPAAGRGQGRTRLHFSLSLLFFSPPSFPVGHRSRRFRGAQLTPRAG